MHSSVVSKSVIAGLKEFGSPLAGKDEGAIERLAPPLGHEVAVALLEQREQPVGETADDCHPPNISEIAVVNRIHIDTNDVARLQPPIGWRRSDDARSLAGPDS